MRCRRPFTLSSYLGRQTANILPPPHDLDLPIMKLLSHPIYNSYHTHITTLSLFPRVYLSYVPPAWNVPMPPIPQAASVTLKEKAWKPRIKMFCEFAHGHCLSPLSSVEPSLFHSGPQG